MCVEYKILSKKGEGTFSEVVKGQSLEDGSLDWKRAEVNEAFRQDIRKVVVRVESNKRPEYNGPIYIDNIRVGK